MKKLVCSVVLAFAALSGAWGQTADLELAGAAPPPPDVVSASVVGSAGSTTFCYWVVAIYPAGNSSPRGVCLSNAPAAANLSGGRYIRVNWTAAANATGYNVVRTTATDWPGSCTSCTVAANTSALTVNDTGAALTDYVGGSLALAAKASIRVNTRDYAAPRIESTIPFAVAPGGMADPTTTRGDLIYRGATGTTRLPVGALNQCLVSNGTDPGWAACPGGLTDPMTTRGDLIYRGAGGTTRLAVGSLNQCLISNGTDPGWGACPGGLTDPMTTRGDLIYRGAGGTTRLALGANGTCLTSNGTDAAWSACTSGTTYTPGGKGTIVFGPGNTLEVASFVALTSDPNTWIGDNNAEDSSWSFPHRTAAAGPKQIPSAAANAKKAFFIPDCESTSACTTGGGSNPALAYSNGVSWIFTFLGASNGPQPEYWKVGSVSRLNGGFVMPQRWEGIQQEYAGIYTESGLSAGVYSQGAVLWSDAGPNYPVYAEAVVPSGANASGITLDVIFYPDVWRAAAAVDLRLSAACSAADTDDMTGLTYTDGSVVHATPAAAGKQTRAHFTVPVTCAAGKLLLLKLIRVDADAFTGTVWFTGSVITWR